MTIEKEDFYSFYQEYKSFIDKNGAYKLRQHDVIAVILPKAQRIRYKLFDKISVNEVLSICGQRYSCDSNTCFMVVNIDYEEFPWWQFWKRKKYVKKYYLEVM